MDSDPSLEVIDIFNPGTDEEGHEGHTGFFKRRTKEKLCVEHKAPLVPIIWEGEVKDLNAYWEAIKPLVDKTWNEMKKEGIVIKGFLKGYGQLFLKEKHPDAIKASREPRTEKDGNVIVDTREVLDPTEIYGAIKKVHVEIGEKIKDKAMAMPRVAGRVREECDKHDKRFPGAIFDYYCKYLEKLSKMPNLLDLPDMEYQG